MGGTVAVTLRKPDGTEYRMDRWTNSMPWGIGNMKMLKHDMAHVDDYLKQWLEMRDDYERNKATGKFELNMTECYATPDGLAPCGYGLVVVDMVNNVILSMQDYTAFDSMCAASVQLDIPHNTADADSNYQIFKEFFDAGQVKGMLTRDSFDNARSNNSNDLYAPVPDCFDEVLALLDPSKRDVFEFKLDLKPFTLETFDGYNTDELKAYRARLLELGFVITDEENKIWDDLITEYEEEEEDA